MAQKSPQGLGQRAFAAALDSIPQVTQHSQNRDRQSGLARPNGWSRGSLRGDILTAIQTLLRILAAINSTVLGIGRVIAGAAIAIMVVVILIQVFFRYVLGNALPWPDEAARFLMLWMTGLIAPSAYRIGGFVSIEMVRAALPRRVGEITIFILLLVALAVLCVGVRYGFSHVNSGWLFASSSLKLPLSLIGMKTVAIKLAWMYMSLLVGLILLVAVNVELILESLIRLFDPNAEPPKQVIDLAVQAD